MTHKFTLLTTAIVAAFVFSPQAKANSLETTYVGGNGQQGIYFDVEAANAIQIIGFRVGLNDAVTEEVTLYSRPGTWVGFDSSPAGWTTHAPRSLTAAAIDGPSSFYLIDEPILVQAGERRGLLVQTEAGGTTVSYTNGDGIGTVEASDANLTIYEGSSENDAFTSAAGNRIPNVTIVYRIVDNSPPAIRMLSRKKVRTNDSRVRLRGVAISALGVDTIDYTFRKLKNSGKVKKVRKSAKPDSFLIFTLNVKTFNGRNPVSAIATDVTGQKSSPAKVTVIGPNE